MDDLANDPPGRRHSLSDWLALHELDAVTCRGILDAMTGESASEAAAHEGPNLEYEALGAEVAWLRTAEAMRCFLPEHRSVIDDTFEKTIKIALDRSHGSGKALTLDNGPTAYPTILFSYRGRPSDFLVIAHEFGHALQIRASRGKFVPPIVREVCAFLGENALLSHTLRYDATQYTYLAQVWRKANCKYFATQRDRLQAALLEPDAPYNYSWNYPIARHLAIQISKRSSPKFVWSVFEGKSSFRGILQEMASSPI